MSCQVPSGKSLSGRERECLEWVSRGKSASDVGAILGLSGRTVESYLSKACAKLHVRTRIEAVAAAVRCGLIDPLQ
ncbi:response regulator transcription factor [Brevundimonas nasdae]|uniref:Helix-turn-helix transcriptional regulator n=1 Tax=Brevundimonas nasdae TaxID=172043 RepID=A0ABX8TN06_9CAUL|nr:helix-turn-helix transcriptional regulator [Brevundimonas nasdae]QYC11443.1 helix-turn-helix transcriptional regulator [Brevundimonas nasdae]QYC14231.1 helix-turn-helix transcriptional regulator [Brevundimonas nasdae]